MPKFLLIEASAEPLTLSMLTNKPGVYIEELGEP